MLASPVPVVPTHHAMTLDEIMRTRHSSRRFLHTPVPKEILYNALQLANNSPSNSNTQPWRIYLLSSAALGRLKTAITTAAEANPIVVATPLPADYQRFRSELGKVVYGEGLGIARDDSASRRAAQMRNYDFFGAPTAAIVCMDKRLDTADALGVGMYLQSLLLGLMEDGVGSCVEVSVTTYTDVIRREVGIPDQMDILCGVAIGYEDPGEKVNSVRPKRLRVEDTIIVLEE